jgi:hypothetical protein
MKQGLVAHDEGADDLQPRDLQGEVEGRDEAHRAIRPPHAVAHLPRVVARHPERPRREPRLRSTHSQTSRCHPPNHRMHVLSVTQPIYNRCMSLETPLKILCCAATA